MSYAGAASGVIQGIQGMGNIAMGFVNAGIMRTQGKIILQRAEYNAKMSDIQIGRMKEATDERAQDYMKSVGAIMGKQKVAFASQNVKVNTGSARNVQVQTRKKAQENIIRMRAAAQTSIRGIEHKSADQMLAAVTRKEQLDKEALYSSMMGVSGGIANMAMGALKTMDAMGGGGGGGGGKGEGGNEPTKPDSGLLKETTPTVSDAHLTDTLMKQVQPKWLDTSTGGMLDSLGLGVSDGTDWFEGI